MTHPEVMFEQPQLFEYERPWTRQDEINSSRSFHERLLNMGPSDYLGGYCKKVLFDLDMEENELKYPRPFKGLVSWHPTGVTSRSGRRRYTRTGDFSDSFWVFPKSKRRSLMMDYRHYPLYLITYSYDEGMIDGVEYLETVQRRIAFEQGRRG